VLRWPGRNCELEVVSIRLPSEPNVNRETNGGFSTFVLQLNVVTVTRQVPTSDFALPLFPAVATAGDMVVETSSASAAAMLDRRKERRPEIVFIVMSPLVY
jgi:hypothetical protein